MMWLAQLPIAIALTGSPVEKVTSLQPKLAEIASDATRTEDLVVAFPGEIAPAIFPYMLCLIVSRQPDVELDPAVAGLLSPEITIGSDCSSYRENAVRESHRLLRESGNRDRGNRQALIDAALTGLEESVVSTTFSSVRKSNQILQIGRVTNDAA